MYNTYFIPLVQINCKKGIFLRNRYKIYSHEARDDVTRINVPAQRSKDVVASLFRRRYNVENMITMKVVLTSFVNVFFDVE